MHADLEALVEANVAAAVEDLCALLAFDTSLPPGQGYAAVTRWLACKVEALGFETETVTLPEQLWQRPGLGLEGPRINLVAHRHTSHPPVSVYAHMDVVPPGPGWTVPPFQGTVRGDRVYGRGSADMKGAIASLLAALRALADAGWPLTFQPILLFCTDEEGGSYPGIRCLAEQGFVQGHLLCLDGQAKPRRWAGCCGMVDYRCVVLGKGGHSGEPGQAGANAIEAAIPILVALQELKGRVEQRRSAMPAAPWNPVRYVQPRLNVTLIRGGSKSNVIPAECEIWINRRYLPEEDLDAVVAELEEVLQSPGIPLRLNGVMAHLPPVRNPIGPHWPSWEGALAKGFGYRPSDFVLYGSSTSSDMGWVQETGVQEILLGGLSRPENNVHGPDEWVSITDLAALAKALALYLAGWTC